MKEIEYKDNGRLYRKASRYMTIEAGEMIYWVKLEEVRCGLTETVLLNQYRTNEEARIAWQELMIDIARREL